MNKQTAAEASQLCRAYENSGGRGVLHGLTGGSDKKQNDFRQSDTLLNGATVK